MEMEREGEINKDASKGLRQKNGLKLGRCEIQTGRRSNHRSGMREDKKRVEVINILCFC